MDPSQQEDYVASLRCVPSRTKVIQFPSSCPGEDLPVLTHSNPAEERFISILNPHPHPSQEHSEEAAGEGVQL